MAKKNSKKNNNTNEVVSIVSNVNINEVGDVNKDTKENTELSNNVCEDDTTNSGGLSISDLYYYKKCNEILLLHYNNLINITSQNDVEYSKFLKKLNFLKRVDCELLTNIDEKISDVCTKLK